MTLINNYRWLPFFTVLAVASYGLISWWTENLLLSFGGASLVCAAAHSLLLSRFTSPAAVR